MEVESPIEHHIVPPPDFDRGLGKIGMAGLIAALFAAFAYVIYSIYIDATAAGVREATFLPFLLLLLALLIALGFEFVNGFHDTANAVATVIYTNAMPATTAVVWSGFFNFLGVLLSSGVVAFGIISLLPVELILQVGSEAGFAMVFALLLAAILWNLATWYLGIPASSSHTLIGSIIGVGVANAMLNGKNGTAGVDWTKATEIGQALLISPLIGFGVAALLFLAIKALVRNEALYREPVDGVPPPLWIRGLLIFTCTGVSFAHGSNDGQKGMGLIMLILIGTVPSAYALNRAVPERYVADFHIASIRTIETLGDGAPAPVVGVGTARAEVTRFISERSLRPDTIPALRGLVADIDRRIQGYGSIAAVPAAAVDNIRNDMYLTAEAIKRVSKDHQPAFDEAKVAQLTAYKGQLDSATRFIPNWVKVAVALALGLGTMVGWKRIVITVGQKIGKSHLTYAQGAVAELVAMGTILSADRLALPVSTTHVLSSGVAGTMAANRSGLQMGTVRNLLIAWVLTLPVSILLSAGLYAFFTLLL